MSKDVSIDFGTVLAIPTGNGRWALGQVIFPGVDFYLGVTLRELVEPISASDIEGNAFELYSWTNDAEVYRNNWQNLGVYELQKHNELPEYKVMMSGKFVVKSFSGDETRNFDPKEDSDLQYRKSRSPLLVQDAVQAALGHGTWKPYYDSMKA